MTAANFAIRHPNQDFTVLPTTLALRQRKAENYLDHFSAFTNYRHGRRNRYLTWLNSEPDLSSDFIVKFFCYWYPVSRHQPQILLKIASAFPDRADRRLVYRNYVEEDGMAEDHHQAHYDLLETLIDRLGGTLEVDAEAEGLVKNLHKRMAGMSAAQATGYLCAIEHPALDISAYFRRLTTLAGHAKLLESDPYLSIHVDVEPSHIIWAHGNALNWMQDEARQRYSGYSGFEVLEAFTEMMAFWEVFWAGAFSRLGYRQ